MDGAAPGALHLSPCGRGRIASSDAIRVRGYFLSIDLNPSPQPSPARGEGAHCRCRGIASDVDGSGLPLPQLEQRSQKFVYRLACLLRGFGIAADMRVELDAGVLVAERRFGVDIHEDA